MIQEVTEQKLLNWQNELTLTKYSHCYNCFEGLGNESKESNFD